MLICLKISQRITFDNVTLLLKCSFKLICLEQDIQREMSDKVFKLDTQIDTIISDIEGTTTSISFVKVTKSVFKFLFTRFLLVKIQECLFPYIRANLKDYLHKNFDNQETIDDITLLRSQV